MARNLGGKLQTALLYTLRQVGNIIIVPYGQQGPVLVGKCARLSESLQ
jgi:hypothetical protein